jgi:hypothetical protein
MSLRAFVDSGGNEWQVFDVVPRAGERRSGERRGLETAPETFSDRRETERRLTVGDVARLSTLSEGWLVFERGSDLRRLSPIPGDWNRCTDAVLEDYCRRALPVRPRRGDVTHQ